MIDWLSHPNELGHPPYEIACTHEFDRNDEHFYVFKYTKDIDGKWLVGVCGDYESEEASAHSGFVFSHFQEYSEETAISDAIEMVEAIEDYWKREYENWPTDE